MSEQICGPRQELGAMLGKSGGTPDLAGGTPRAGSSRAVPWEAAFTPGGKRERGIAGLSCIPGVCTHSTTVCGLGATRSLIWPDSTSHLVHQDSGSPNINTFINIVTDISGANGKLNKVHLWDSSELLICYFLSVALHWI